MKRFYHALNALPGVAANTRRWAWAGPVALCLCLPAAQAQQQYPRPGEHPPHLSPGEVAIPSSNNDPIAARMLARLAAKRNVQRQQQLVADTDKLLLLAQQLKADVDKTNKDTLSVDVIKKAGEIEKLAKSVKDKMKAQ